MNEPTDLLTERVAPAQARGETVLASRRARQVWLATKRQELMAPVSATRDLCDMLRQEAHDQGRTAFAEDLDKIHQSSRQLEALIQEVLNPADGTLPANFAKRVRHDLRTPLAHIKGLCEILLEDAADQLIEGFVDDLRQIHDWGNQFLERLEDLVEFPHMVPVPEPVLPDDNAVPCVDDHTSDRAETGSILVVDDNAVNRDLLERRLTRYGHKVTLAQDGRQALDVVRSQDFDLILLDIIMPRLNGIETLKQLKADAALRHIPVIMISALAELEDVVHCIACGAEDYLSRPFNQTLLRARINACLEKKHLRDREVLYLAQIKKEQERSDALLHVILPGEIVKELKDTDQVRPRRYDHVAVLFCDIVGFTPFCDANPPESVVPHLQELIEAWEEIAERHHVEKIKTIGDAFMAAAGLLRKQRANPVRQCVECGLEMIAACRRLPTNWNLRVGIHVGPVVAGVIGRRQYLFDLWGDTVNTAARMESHGIAGEVVLSSAAWQQIAHLGQMEALGQVKVKGKGAIDMVRFVEFHTS